MQHQINSMTNWMYPFTPRSCGVCGHTMTPSAMQPGIDMLGQLSRLYQPMMDSMTQMWSGLLAPLMNPATNPLAGQMMRGAGQAHATAHHRNQDDCQRCASDKCHCQCCVSDADLLVYARVGERRIVPINIQNSRRRERDISLDLSNWTTRSGKPATVTGELAQPTKFTLKACEEREVILTVQATAQSTDNPNGSAGQRQAPDVDECEVFYADLRVEGCDIRPIRIAVALLPRDCAAFEVDCRCSCC